MKKQTKTWIDESGNQIPENRVTPFEKKREKIVHAVIGKAQKVEAILAEFHKSLAADTASLFSDYKKEFDVKKDRKGNFTYYSFDRSAKIEVNISEPITFDENTISACKEKLDQFLDVEIEKVDDFVKEIVKSAFETKRGQMDSNKVLGLLKYKSKVKNKIYTEAMDLLEQAIRKPSKKTYYKLYLKDAMGEYQHINLNFANL